MPNMETYAQYLACAHIFFVAIVIAFVLSKKEHEKKMRQRPQREPQGAKAPLTPSMNEVGAFAFPIDETRDFLKVWSPRQRVFAAS
jgi:hypothetical protein